MGSRDKDQMTPHQPLLSSLVVRPTDAGGGGGGGEYEPGEVRRDPPPYSRSDRYDGQGYRIRAGSVSPVRRRDAHHHFSPDFEPSDGALRNRGLGNGREPGRYRDYSPTYGRGKDGGRFAGRGFDRSAPSPGSLRGEGLRRNNPNVQPREGDWICSDPLCKNLNFARREYCNNCTRPRYGSPGSPRRGGYPGPAFPPVRQRLPPIPLDHSPRDISDGYRSPPPIPPPRGWLRDGPRDFRSPPVPVGRHEGKFLDPFIRSDRRLYPEDDPRDRYRYDRAMVSDWDHRDHRARDSLFSERQGFGSGRGRGRRALSPSLAVPPRGWSARVRDRSRSRSRSRSPIRRRGGGGGGGGGYLNRRRREDRRSGGHDE
ncbi:uncharacterized protein LOC127263755 [Andrographis paniculata]|uniref:uncharacterized protein LOC127263755 n=1 Tax=Andrographis paniculata TaxID=175694 RepID=UPI0021E71165|nr:uncharacterized protein LOC127263755 [Andrographis paniculata]